MGKGTGLSRGDRCRNERLDLLRSVVGADRAIVGIDLADDIQAVVVTDHDSKVLARRRVRVRAWELGPTLEWARSQAVAAGFADVVVGCEPTGHRWRIVDQLAGSLEMAVVCVQPLLVGRAREAEDLTRDKTDDKDAVLIARLVSELRCYLPERPDEAWARLRQLGARRAALITQSTACTQQIRDLLECAWPAALTAAGKPFDSKSWQAAMSVVLDRADGAHLSSVRSMGWSRFSRAVTTELPRWEAKRCHTRIVRAVFDALDSTTGVRVQRRAALERTAMVFDDWHHCRRQLADIENRMKTVLDDLDLTALVTSIPGLSAVGAAQILAETGDPNRFASPRSLVKHAGLCPRENTSGNHLGTARISGRGRPGLRLAAWRAVWPALRTNPVYAARFEHLTTRDDNPLTAGQARTAICAALLRQLHVVVTRRTPWDPTRAGAAPPAALAA